MTFLRQRLWIIAAFLLASSSFRSCHAFISPSSSSRTAMMTRSKTMISTPTTPSSLLRRSKPTSLTKLDMYSGGGGGPPLLPPPDQNNWKSIATTALTIVGVILFFASPLGGIVLGIFNSLLLISILAPFILFGAFQIWQQFNTITGPCPSCGAPCQVVKSDTTRVENTNPSLCLNCGTIIQANFDNTGIEPVSTSGNANANNKSDMFAVWDNLFGTTEEDEVITTTTTTTTTTTQQERAGRNFQRQQTVIDVQIDDDDDNDYKNKPFQ